MRRSRRVAAAKAASDHVMPVDCHFGQLSIDLQERIIEGVVREAGEDGVATVVAARQTCQAWRRLVGACLHSMLSPASFQTARHLTAFPTITILDLQRAASCGAVSTAAVQQLPVRLPQVTDLYLGALSSLPLPCVKALALLTALQTLSFEGCQHVYDEHLAALTPLAGTLTALHLSCCGTVEALITSQGGIRSLAALTNLRQLTLRGLRVVDTDLEHIGACCSRLENVDLTDVSEFRGSGISSLTGLTLLAVSGVRSADRALLAGSLSRLTGLSSLSVSAWSLPNGRFGAGALAVQQLTKLRNLVVFGGIHSYNRPLTWPCGLADLRQLQHVALQQIDPLETLQDYTGGWSTALRDLDLQGWEDLSEESLTNAVRQFPGLTRLILHEIYEGVRDGTAGEMLRCLTGLRTLELKPFSGGVPGNGRVLDILVELPALQDLDLSDSSGLDLRSLRAATGLTRLALCNIMLQPQLEPIRHRLQDLTKAIEVLAPLTQLAVLLLDQNELKEATMRAVANLTSLTDLSLKWSTVSDEGLQPLSRLSRLAVLNASRCLQLTPQGLTALYQLPALRDVSVQGSGPQPPRDPWPALHCFARPYLRLRA